MPSFSESIVEQATLEWFEALGYTILNASEIAPEEPNSERETYADVVLRDRLQTALVTINPDISANAIADAIRKVTQTETPSLYENNRRFHKFLTDGVDVEYQADGYTKYDKVWLIDFHQPENNDWLAVNQFTVIENKHNRRPDVVVFINGLPIAVIELKNPVEENATIKGAFNQLQTYKNEIPCLFPYNEMLMVSDGTEARVGTLTADWERFMPWRTIDGEKIAPKATAELETLIKGIFPKDRILDLLRYFIIFETDSDLIVKKMAGYHQYHAVNKAITATVKATDATGNRKAGVVWHTQGSGKSLTMAFYAGKIVQHPALSNPTLVVLTDRNDLDDQLFNTFSNCADLLRQTPVQADDRKHLRDLLQVASGGIVFTTIQKFSPESGEEYPQLSDRRNIVFIADEAHRSQYGLNARVVVKSAPEAKTDNVYPIGKRRKSSLVAAEASDNSYLHTLYVDKPMKGHGLMQAIARVNRVFKDKPGGLIVDYLGIADQLKEALKDYTESDRGETGIPTETALALLQEKYEVIGAIYHGFDYSPFFTGSPSERLAVIPAAMDFVLGLEDGKNRYVKAVSELGKAFALVSSMDEAIAIRDEVGFFQAIKVAIGKHTTRDNKSAEDLDTAVRQIVSKAVASEEVIDIFATAGLKNPDISILSDEFLEEVRGLPHKNLALEVLRKLLNDEIKTRSRKNLVQSRTFSEMLENTIKRYQNRSIEAAQVIAELIELVKEIRQAQSRGEDLGLTEDEVAFYDALEVNDSAVLELGDATLKAIARDLVQAIKNNVTIDWTMKEGVRAKLRVTVKRLLKKYGYPPDKQEKATVTVLQQAELLCKDWIS
jgi:type I site-specific restriction-modification system R (restriction) subunit